MILLTALSLGSGSPSFSLSWIMSLKFNLIKLFTVLAFNFNYRMDKVSFKKEFIAIFTSIFFKKIRHIL